MPLSSDYVARETVSNLWRNRLMTIAAVLTVAVSLTLVGAALLLRQGASAASTLWEGETQVQVWMNHDASQSELHAVSVQLAQLPLVRQPCQYKDQAQSYADAKQVLAQDVISNLPQNLVPSFFECVPQQPADAQAVVTRFKGQPGVYDVTAPFAQIRAEEETINVLKWTFLGIALVLVVSAAVLILNTIRMAIFARRREVSVMKLVGATNWFIRVPFMSEGLVQGVVGSAVAIGAVMTLRAVLDALGHTSGTILNQIRITGWDAFWIDIVLLFVGTLIGSAGSAIAIRRFLDV